MKNFKKIISALLCLCVIVGAAFCLASCNGNDTENTTEAPTEKPTEKPTEAPTEPEAVVVYVDFTLTLADQDGEKVVGATLNLVDALGVVFSGKSDENGVISGNAPEGEYTVQYDHENSPIGYFLGDTSKITLSGESKEIAIELTNNIPNGSEDRPFIINSTEADITLAAGESFHYVTYGGNGRTLSVFGESFEMTYNDTVYTPVDGVVSFVVSAEDVRDATAFVIKNTSEAEITLKLTLVSPLGSHENPIAIEALGENITASVPEGAIVYYKWVALKNGVVTVSSADPLNNICISNYTNSNVSSYTEGAACEHLRVSEGDEIYLYVAVVGEESADITFSLSFSEGSAADPVELLREEATLLVRSGEAYTFTHSFEGKTVTLNGENIEIVCGGTTYTPDASDEITLPADAEKTFTVKNTGSDNVEIRITVN